MAAHPIDASGDIGAAPSGKRSKRKLIVMAVPVLLGGVGAGLWFTGILPGFLGMGHEPHAKEAGPVLPIYVDLPEMVANLNGNARRPSYVKLRARLELSRPEDEAAVRAAMPRLVDLFQTYLRDMRPEELRGSAGTYRLREELIARASIAAAPAHVRDVLFTEMIVQ